MTVEEKLKDCILTKYKSVRQFTIENDIAYSTVATIFQNGIGKANISTVIKICQALGISTDELIQGRITYLDDSHDDSTSVEDIYADFIHALRNTKNLTFCDFKIQPSEVDGLVSALNIVIEIEKGLRKNKEI